MMYLLEKLFLTSELDQFEKILIFHEVLAFLSTFLVVNTR